MRGFGRGSRNLGSILFRRQINEMSQKFKTPVGTIKRRLHVAKRLAKELESLSPA
jgi:hypothetical protein